MRFKIIAAALGFVASVPALQAQPDLRRSTWQQVTRSTIEEPGEPNNASVTYLATGFDLTRVGSAVHFKILTLYKHPVGLEAGYSLEWKEYLADCSTLQMQIMSAWSRGRRGWRALLETNPSAEELAPNMSDGQIIRGACGLLPLNGEPLTDPERAASEILARM